VNAPTRAAAMPAYSREFEPQEPSSTNAPASPRAEYLLHPPQPALGPDRDVAREAVTAGGPGPRCSFAHRPLAGVSAPHRQHKISLTRAREDATVDRKAVPIETRTTLVSCAPFPFFLLPGSTATTCASVAIPGGLRRPSILSITPACRPRAILGIEDFCRHTSVSQRDVRGPALCARLPVGA